MSEARTSLETIRTFISAAQAYMKGHLHCPPTQEDLLWRRLTEAKSNIPTALADDFDTPRAVGALMKLVYHGNCQLRPVSTAEGGVRSPAVFGAMVTYVRDVLDVFGIDLLHSREADVMSSSGNLQAVVEQLTRFRSEVRAFALTRQDSQDKKSDLSPDRIPLLKSCDTLRKDLAPLGVVIKDRGATSTWEIKPTQSGQRSHEPDQQT